MKHGKKIGYGGSVRQISPTTVLKQYNFPGKIEILDTTLRDGEQQPSLFISLADRIGVGKQMDAIGIHTH